MVGNDFADTPEITVRFCNTGKRNAQFVSLCSFVSFLLATEYAHAGTHSNPGWMMFGNEDPAAFGGGRSRRVCRVLSPFMNLT